MRRKIKKLNILMLIPLLWICQACSDWLDVKPKAEIEASVLFETENGFKDALTGIYLNMSDAAAYGKEMTFGFIDVLGQQYEMEYYNSYYKVKYYQYEEVSYYIDEIWAKMYNVIANINNLLKQLEDHREVLHPNVYAMIKGECLGLRAFIHFDLLRVWGYGDLERHPEYLDEKTIPYVTRFEKHISPQLTQREVLKKIHEDLEEARELLQYTDSYSYFPKDMDFELPDANNYFTNRQIHFNFCALRATQARVFLWEGKYTEAFNCANEIIASGINRFNWVGAMTGPDRKKYDLLFSTEHIFALDILDMYSNFEVNQLTDDGSGAGIEALYQTTSKVYAIYEVPGVGTTDYRYMYHYDPNSPEKKPLLKFYQTEDYLYRNRMPLIRKSELYYILAECLNRTGVQADREQAIKHLNMVRSYRNIEVPLALSLTQEEVDAEIQKEYQKEFISEGQLFFYYKRLGVESIPLLNILMDKTHYVVPLPDIEMEFGRTEQIPEVKDQH